MDARGWIRSLYSEPAKAGRPPIAIDGPPIKVHFDQGLPDPTLFPVDSLKQFLVETMEQEGVDACRYYGDGGPLEMQYGHLGLRQEIAARLSRRDKRTIDVDGVLLVNGSTDGLALSVKAFLGPGDGALVEQATYTHTKQFMVATGAEIRPIPMDADGMDVDTLDSCLRSLEGDGFRPKLVYTTPTFQSPTTTVLSLERRHQLLEIASAWGVIVLEDNCYYEFGYDRPPPPTLLALDRAGVVLQSDSFSKYIAPGLRMAWMAGAPDAIEGLVRVRQDFAVSQVMARALRRYLASGDYDDHVASLREVYHHKRDLTVDALRRHCNQLVAFRVPEGGFNVWLELVGVDWDAARTQLIAAGIAFRPGEQFMDGGAARRFVRLSFVQVPDDDIEWGIATLGSVLAACATGS